MISSLRHKHDISWTSSNNALVISAKKKRITLIKSVSQPRRLASRRDLNFTFPRANDGVLVPFLYQSPRSRSRRVSYLKVPIVKYGQDNMGVWSIRGLYEVLAVFSLFTPLYVCLSFCLSVLGSSCSFVPRASPGPRASNVFRTFPTWGFKTASFRQRTDTFSGLF